MSPDARDARPDNGLKWPLVGQSLDATLPELPL
jgi:hypothetical protein